METKFELFRELIEFSQNERRGLTVFVNGQTIVGIVKEVVGQEAIVMSSQTFSKIIVRLEAIDAMAI
jgi:hypothetical protein